MIYSEYVLISILIPILLTCIYVKGSARRYAAFFAAGMITCLFAAYFGGTVQHMIGAEDEWMSVYVSPVSEEFFKMLPLLVYLLLSDPRMRNCFPPVSPSRQVLPHLKTAAISLHPARITCPSF